VGKGVVGEERPGRELHGGAIEEPVEHRPILQKAHLEAHRGDAGGDAQIVLRQVDHLLLRRDRRTSSRPARGPLRSFCWRQRLPDAIGGEIGTVRAQRQRRVELGETGAAKTELDESDVAELPRDVAPGQGRCAGQLAVDRERAHERAPRVLAGGQGADHAGLRWIQLMDVGEVRRHLAREKGADVAIEIGYGDRVRSSAGARRQAFRLPTAAGAAYRLALCASARPP
jgi:hypothetical protein